jgi:hypothetical protein
MIKSCTTYFHLENKWMISEFELMNAAMQRCTCTPVGFRISDRRGYSSVADEPALRRHHGHRRPGHCRRPYPVPRLVLRQCAIPRCLVTELHVSSHLLVYPGGRPACTPLRLCSVYGDLILEGGQSTEELGDPHPRTLIPTWNNSCY